MKIGMVLAGIDQILFKEILWTLKHGSLTIYHEKNKIETNTVSKDGKVTFDKLTNVSASTYHEENQPCHLNH